MIKSAEIQRPYPLGHGGRHTLYLNRLLIYYLDNEQQRRFWFGLMLNVPVNNFFSHVGTEPPLPVYYQYFFFFFFFFGGGGGKYVLLKDTTRRPEWGSNPRPLDPESEVLTTRPPRPHSKGGDQPGSVQMHR